MFHNPVKFLLGNLFRYTEIHKRIPHLNSSEHSDVKQSLLQRIHRHLCPQSELFQERLAESILKKPGINKGIMQIMGTAIRERVYLTQSDRKSVV